MKNEYLVPEEVLNRIRAGELATIQKLSAETNVPEQTIRDWVRLGYVERVHISKRRIVVNRQQVLACLEVYHPRPTAQR